jgi:hypothetical protein
MKDLGLALHFVQRYGARPADQGFWIAAGDVEYVEVVKRRVLSSARSEMLCQSTLAGLAGAGDHYGGHDA